MAELVAETFEDSSEFSFEYRDVKEEKTEGSNRVIANQPGKYPKTEALKKEVFLPYWDYKQEKSEE
jgi:hypothetical protein